MQEYILLYNSKNDESHSPDSQVYLQDIEQTKYRYELGDGLNSSPPESQNLS